MWIVTRHHRLLWNLLVFRWQNTQVGSFDNVGLIDGKVQTKHTTYLQTLVVLQNIQFLLVFGKTPSPQRCLWHVGLLRRKHNVIVGWHTVVITLAVLTPHQGRVNFLDIMSYLVTTSGQLCYKFIVPQIYLFTFFKMDCEVCRCILIYFVWKLRIRYVKYRKSSRFDFQFDNKRSYCDIKRVIEYESSFKRCFYIY